MGLLDTESHGAAARTSSRSGSMTSAREKQMRPAWRLRLARA
jgi:hypothetical protein